MTKGKILIVDDSRLNVELLQETLEPFNYAIAAYSNPFNALEKEKNTKIDLAIIDVVMPGIDGFEFAQRLLIDHPSTPVAFVSAHNEKENKIKGYNTGSIVYIEKPFDIKTIRAQIHSILKLKSVQDELLREKQKLDNIFEYTSNEILLVDTDFNIVSQNRKILNSSDFEHTNFLDILDERGEQEHKHEVLRFVKSDKNHFQIRLVFDNTKYLKTTFSRIKPNDTDTGFLIIMEDMTEEIERQNMRTNFIAMLTHDLKTPVRAEKRALQLLLEGSFGSLSNEQKEIVQEILNSSRYMLRMTDNVLTRYKIESGDFKINKTSNSIKKSLQTVLESLDYLFEAKKQTVKITSKIEDEQSAVFDYDDVEIKRALTNLISNAAEYSPDSSEINIIIKKDSKNIEISIKDNGRGIPETVLDSVWKEQVNLETRFKKVGSGLGLYVTKKIIEAHDGKIKIETDTKKSNGTNCIVSLPYTRSQTPSLIQS